jgi:drug/metabolite transporter (DMT)-like permease
MSEGASLERSTHPVLARLGARRASAPGGTAASWRNRLVSRRGRGQPCGVTSRLSTHDPAAAARTVHPGRGLAQVTVAAVLFGVNASVSKVVLQAGVAPRQLAALRCTGVALGLLVLLGPTAGARLRVPWRSLPQLAVLGVVGAALIQWFYFVAIDRLPVGIAILLEFTGPVMVAVWARLVLREQVRPVVWLALGLSLGGLALVAQVWQDARLDALGVAAALAAAACLATFLLLGRHTGGAHDPVAVNFWMFGCASLFWLVVEPPWRIDGAPLAETTSLLGAFDGVEVPVWVLVLWVIALGTLAPYALDLAALRHLSATTVGAVGMLEPVVATVVAWAWLGQSLSTAQVLGGVIVLAGVGLAQTATNPAGHG